jgi:hypothetical protein
MPFRFSPLVVATIATVSNKASLEGELWTRGDSTAAEVPRLGLGNARLEAECDRLRTRRKKTVVRDAKGQITEVIEAPARPKRLPVADLRSDQPENNW